MADLLEKNKAIVRRWVNQVFNEHNLDLVEDLKVTNYIDWNPYPGQNFALQGFKSVLISFLSAFPDFHYDVEEELAEGDIVVCIGTWSGTHTGNFMNIPQTGKRMSAKRIDIVRLSGDKMTERWGTGNELKMMQLMMGSSSPMKQSENTDDGRSIARRFVEEVFNQKQLMAIEELVEDGATQNSRGTLALFLLSTAFPDFRLTAEQIIAQGDQVTLLLNFSATHTREFMGISPTNQQVTAQPILTLQITNDKIVESRFEFNLSNLAQQISTQQQSLQNQTK